MSTRFCRNFLGEFEAVLAMLHELTVATRQPIAGLTINAENFLRMSLTFNFFLRVLVVFVLGRVFRLDRVVFGNFQALMSGDAIIANKFLTVDAVTCRGKFIVGTLRNFFG